MRIEPLKKYKNVIVLGASLTTTIKLEPPCVVRLGISFMKYKVGTYVIHV